MSDNITWTADIHFKTDKPNLLLENLQYITKFDGHNGECIKITDFNSFKIAAGEKLVFVCENTSFVFPDSKDFFYIKFSKSN